MIEDNGHEQLSRPIMKNLRVTVELLRHRLHAATFVGLNASRRLILPVLGIRPFSIRKSSRDHRRAGSGVATAWAGEESASALLLQ